MPSNVTRIGAYEAKTKFSELLSRVAEAGAEFVITKHDRPVARLVPAVKVHSQEEAVKGIADWRRERKRRQLRGLRIKDLVSEGRR